MTDVDPFDDDIFSGNGAGGGGLDEVCDQPCIFIPQEYKLGTGLQGSDKSDKYLVVAKVVSFGDPANPEVHDELPIFGTALVSGMKQMAKKNEAGVLTEKGFPFMKLGVPFKNKAKGKVGNPMWDMKAIEDENLRRAMAKYAHENLRASDPFSD